MLGPFQPLGRLLCWLPGSISRGSASASCRRSKPARCTAAWRRQPLRPCSSRPSRFHTSLGQREGEKAKLMSIKCRTPLLPQDVRSEIPIASVVPLLRRHGQSCADSTLQSEGSKEIRVHFRKMSNRWCTPIKSALYLLQELILSVKAYSFLLMSTVAKGKQE